MKLLFVEPIHEVREYCSRYANEGVECLSVVEIEMERRKSGRRDGWIVKVDTRRFP